MDHSMKNFKRISLCAAIALIAFSASQALAFDANDDITITTLTPAATPAIGQDMDFGTWTVIPDATDTANLVLSNTGVLSSVDLGGPGDARFIGSLAQPAADELIFNLTGALPQVTMSFQIGAPGVTPGTFAGADVTIDSATPSTGTFVANTWTCAVNSTALGTVAAEVLTGFDGSTGIATSLTTGEDAGGDGVASIVCGATLTTVPGTDPYTGGTYNGDVRVTVNY